MIRANRAAYPDDVARCASDTPKGASGARIQKGTRTDEADAFVLADRQEMRIVGDDKRVKTPDALQLVAAAPNARRF